MRQQLLKGIRIGWRAWEQDTCHEWMLHSPPLIVKCLVSGFIWAMCVCVCETESNKKTGEHRIIANRSTDRFRQIQMLCCVCQFYMDFWMGFMNWLIIGFVSQRWRSVLFTSKLTWHLQKQHITSLGASSDSEWTSNIKWFLRGTYQPAVSVSKKNRFSCTIVFLLADNQLQGFYSSDVVSALTPALTALSLVFAEGAL